VRRSAENIAVVYHVANGVVQVVYWGDLTKFSEHKQ
jgi:hypothetical protein